MEPSHLSARRRFTDPAVEHCDCELARSSLSSLRPERRLRRALESAESSLVVSSTGGRHEPEGLCGRAPDGPMAGLPGSGSERPFSFAVSSKLATVCWERTESPMPALGWELNVLLLRSAIGLSAGARLSKE